MDLTSTTSCEVSAIVADGFTICDLAEPATPDMTMLRSARPPPRLPLDVFGPNWAHWIKEAAEAASCPPDYVAAVLLAAVSALIGNARWPSAPAWAVIVHRLSALDQTADNTL